jgi:hypothetical protein
MHLEGPWLSTVGKRRGKKKWASAEQKRQAELLDAEWQKLKDRYAPKTKLQVGRSSFVPAVPLRRDADRPRLPSLDTGHRGAVNSKQPMQYTGNELIGISVIHKSCLQPIFTQQEAIDAAKMRR